MLIGLLSCKFINLSISVYDLLIIKNTQVIVKGKVYNNTLVKIKRTFVWKFLSNTGTLRICKNIAILTIMDENSTIK
jgi:hypothetical protein